MSSSSHDRGSVGFSVRDFQRCTGMGSAMEELIRKGDHTKARRAEVCSVRRCITFSLSASIETRRFPRSSRIDLRLRILDSSFPMFTIQCDMLRYKIRTFDQSQCFRYVYVYEIMCCVKFIFFFLIFLLFKYVWNNEISYNRLIRKI